MADKKFFSRSEFETFRAQSAKAMADDAPLRQDALDLLTRADRHYWIHQTTWLGEPILNLPQDLFAVQEILFKTRPEFIVEVGVAWGGSLLFYSSLMEVLGGERIIGVDLYMPDDLKARINSHAKLARRIDWIEGSSTEETTLKKIRSIIGNSRRVLVMLDSAHGAEHVLKELRLYSPLVGKGHYLICGDTVVEVLPKQNHRPRSWGPGDSPQTALAVFLKENTRFEVDKTIENKLLLTCHPGGYLRCCED